MKIKRFVKHFYSSFRAKEIEEQINDYANQNNLKIITISYVFQNGIYVLFEEIVEVDDERI